MPRETPKQIPSIEIGIQICTTGWVLHDFESGESFVYRLSSEHQDLLAKIDDLLKEKM